MSRCKFTVGQKVIFDGAIWFVAEWQPLNGIGGCYALRNDFGESATATVGELKPT